MNQPAQQGVISHLVTGVFLVCAVVITALLVRREFAPAARSPGLVVEADESWLLHADSGQRIGSDSARVVVVEFADFQCPACRSLHASVTELLRRYPEQLALVFRHWPLPMHRFARASAIASECAGEQNRFVEMYDYLFQHTDSIGVAAWRSMAQAAGVTDLRAFDACVADSLTAPAVDRDTRVAKSLNTRGTPTVLINGVRFAGAPGLATLDSLVRTALAEQTLKPGVLTR